MKRWHAELAWIGRVAERVLIEVEGERIVTVSPDVDAPADATRLRGLTIPGLANVHSHAFHRALRGRTQAGAGDFWTWRRLMYDVASRLDPDLYLDLARATFAEMALAGITAVGEFHYVHHDKSGAPYASPNAMGEALMAAAREAGVRMTLIDACYLWSGLGQAPPQGVQRRFTDGDAERWAVRAGDLRGDAGATIAAGIHSVRAVDERSMGTVREWAEGRATPLHLHLSEQPRENEECVAATGRTPTALIASAGVPGARTTAVHATHLTAEDIALLGSSGTTVCICTTTERDLGDGIGPARLLAIAGCPLCFGSDMHPTIDLFEEARGMELDERLQSGRRGIHRPADLLDALTAHGMRALGWDAGRLEPGALADFATVGLGSPRLAGARPSEAVEHLVYCATAADVIDVVVGGRPIVAGGVHQLVGDVGQALARAIARLDAAPS